jgi:hypothetical protein
MFRRILSICAASLVLAAPTTACCAETASNVEMTAIFAADQADRQATSVDWSVVTARDTARRERVRALLDAGQLRTADDYYAAAFVFQHGQKPEDHLLAHVLAMGAMTLGRNDASWIAAATLDRYLHNTDRPQVFGTQYRGQPGGPVTQGQYDSALLPDSLRTLLRVPTREQQQERLKQMNPQK